MTVVRHLGSADPAAPFSTIERRSIAVNTANRQLAVGDEASGSVGTPLAMIAVRYFDARARYVLNDVVIQNGIVYKANGTITPAAFNASQWTTIDNTGSVLVDGSRAMTGALTLFGDPSIPQHATDKQYVDAGDATNAAAITAGDATNATAIGLRVLKAGDTMSGHLALPTGPAAANAVRKDYVDAGDAASVATIATDIAAKAVRYDAVQALSSAQQIQARANAYAAPFDAMAYSGMQINGSCEVSQERGSTSFYPASGGTPVAVYAQDNWTLFYLGAATLGISVFPAYAGGPPGFSNCVMFQAAVGLASLAAGDYVQIVSVIEGYRVARLGWGAADAQPITIGFWVRAPVTGTVSVSVRNGASNRSYITNVTVNAATTWEYKTLTVPGDTTGTWDKTTAPGMSITICPGAGSTHRAGTAGSWTTTSHFATSATTNFFGTNGFSFLLTGLTVLPGTQAPTAAQSSLILRPYGEELTTCQRYLEVHDVAITLLPAAGTYIFDHPFRASKRIAPTMSTLIAPAYAGGASGATFNNITKDSVGLSYTSSGTGSYFSNWKIMADARL